MRGDIWEFVVVASLCAVPFMIFITVFGEHGLEVSRKLLNRRYWLDDPLLPLSRDRLAIAVFGEGIGPYLVAATAMISLILLDAAPIPPGAWQLWLAVVVGFASATSAGAVLLSSTFDVSYQRALKLQVAFVLFAAAYGLMFVSGILLLLGLVAGLLLFFASVFAG